MQVLVLFIQAETINIPCVAGCVCVILVVLGTARLPESVFFSFFVLGIWRRTEGSKTNMHRKKLHAVRKMSKVIVVCAVFSGCVAV